MKKIILSLLVLSLYLIPTPASAQFMNGDFEQVICPHDCTVGTSQLDCLPAWFNPYSSGTVISAIQSASCFDDTVCDGQYSVFLNAGSGGNASVIGTANPFYEEVEAPQLVRLTARSNDDDGRIAAFGDLEPATAGLGVELGYQLLETAGTCTEIEMLLSHEVVNYPTLEFAGMINALDGIPYAVVVDNFEALGPLYEVSYDPCAEQLQVDFNTATSYTPPAPWCILVTELDGSIVYSGCDPAFNDLSIAAVPGEYKFFITVEAPNGIGFAVAHEFIFEAVNDGAICCDQIETADFELDVVDNFGSVGLQVSNFELYEEFAAEHVWYVYAVSSDPTVPLEPITFTSTQGAGPHIIFDQGEYGTVYLVIHKLIVPGCGEFCDADLNLIDPVNEETATAAGQITLPAGDLCEFTDDFPTCGGLPFTTPTGLYSYKQGPVGVLVWDEVPGATTYILEPVIPAGCDCTDRVPDIGRETTYNFFLFWGPLARDCFAWRVRAVCAETGELSDWSEVNCYNSPTGGNIGLSGSQKSLDEPESAGSLKTFPNPVREQLTINIKLPYDSEVLVELYDTNGRKVMGYEEHLTIEATQSAKFTWNSLSQLSSGMYFVRCHTNQEQLMTTIVVN
ncbi:MAG: T9SS type A sorting domain-containing protein [Bacteroidota bacterium]